MIKLRKKTGIEMFVLCGWKNVTGYESTTMVRSAGHKFLLEDFNEEIELHCAKWDKLFKRNREVIWMRPTGAELTWFYPELPEVFFAF